jgi:hypothetical protein
MLTFRDPHHQGQGGEWPYVNVYTRVPKQCLILLAHYMAWGQSQTVQSSTWLYPIIMSFNPVFLSLITFIFFFLLINLDDGDRDLLTYRFFNHHWHCWSPEILVHLFTVKASNCTLTHNISTCSYSDRWLLKMATSQKSHYIGLLNE